METMRRRAVVVVVMVLACAAIGTAQEVALDVSVSSPLRDDFHHLIPLAAKNFRATSASRPVWA